jgi:hypothetical protein
MPHKMDLGLTLDSWVFPSVISKEAYCELSERQRNLRKLCYTFVTEDRLELGGTPSQWDNVTHLELYRINSDNPNRNRVREVCETIRECRRLDSLALSAEILEDDSDDSEDESEDDDEDDAEDDHKADNQVRWEVWKELGKGGDKVRLKLKLLGLYQLPLQGLERCVNLSTVTVLSLYYCKGLEDFLTRWRDSNSPINLRSLRLCFQSDSLLARKVSQTSSFFNSFSGLVELDIPLWASGPQYLFPNHFETLETVGNLPHPP